jgi:hypothetical protein
MKDGLIFETDKYHNAAFVGKDKEGKTRLVTLRSIYQDFRNTVAGSDRHFPFRLVAQHGNKVVHVFEAPIDALSYASLHAMNGVDWMEQNYLALCGVFQPRSDDLSQTTIPIAIEQYLKDYPETSCLCVHFDNDPAGELAAKALEATLGQRGRVIIQPPPKGYKDCNEYLVKAVREPARKQSRETAL